MHSSAAPAISACSRRDRKQIGALHHQKRTQTLAAAERRIAHGIEQPGRALDFGGLGLLRQQMVEQPLGIGGAGFQPCNEIFTSGGHRNAIPARTVAAFIGLSLCIILS